MNKIAELRKQNKITQEKLASKIGVARSTLAMYETNKSEPDYETLIKLAEYFNVTIDYLLGRNNNPVGNNTSDDEYTEEEKQFIKDYRSLSPDLQDMIRKTLDIYTQRDTKKNNQQQ